MRKRYYAVSISNWRKGDDPRECARSVSWKSSAIRKRIIPLYVAEYRTSCGEHDFDDGVFTEFYQPRIEGSGSCDFKIIAADHRYLNQGAAAQAEDMRDWMRRNRARVQ